MEKSEKEEITAEETQTKLDEIKKAI